MITIESIQEKYALGFNAALGSVAREKKYLAWTDAPPLESTRAFVKENIEKGIPQIVAVDDGRVVGWCDIAPFNRISQKHRGTLGIGLIEGFRRKGIGTKLLRAALKLAKQYGYEKIELEVFKTNVPAIMLYEKIGFTYEGKRKAAVKIVDQYFDCILMALFMKDYSES